MVQKHVNKSEIKSLEFVLNDAFRKIFGTKSCDIANECVIVLCMTWCIKAQETYHEMRIPERDVYRLYIRLSIDIN